MEPQPLVPDNYRYFLAGANICLGAILGLLIVIPAASALSAPLPLVCPIGLLLGGAVGYRRRSSRAFFYFVLVAVAILSSIIGGTMQSPEQGQPKSRMQPSKGATDCVAAIA